MKNQLINRQFETQLGLIECELFSNNQELLTIGNFEYKNGKSVEYETVGHLIELIECKSRTNELIEDSNCWIFRISKHNDKSEKLIIKCELTKPIKNIDFDTASGEHLDAIEAFNDNWQLCIGTEDGEVLNSRAERDDWFPKRIKSRVSFYESITEFLKGNTGLKTEIPDLKLNEKIHIQYLSAIDKKEGEKINSWTAVDELKWNLENRIGIY